MTTARKPVPKGCVVLTRNYCNYRIVESPIAAIIERLYPRLQSPAHTSIPLRLPFATAFSGQLTDPSEASGLDEAIRQAFMDFPTVILCQGVISPESLLLAHPYPATNGNGSGSPQTPASMVSFASSAASVKSSATGASMGANKEAVLAATAKGTDWDASECIYLGHFLHTELETAISEGDAEKQATVTLHILGSLYYELAHWLYVKQHGFHPDPKFVTPSSSVASLDSPIQSARADREDDTVIARSLNSADVGHICCSLAFGATYNLITYADGTTQVVSRLSDPSRLGLKTTAPVLSNASEMSNIVLEDVLGMKPPKKGEVVDVERLMGGRKKGDWDNESGFKVSTKMGPNFRCQHGICHV